MFRLPLLRHAFTQRAFNFTPAAANFSCQALEKKRYFGACHPAVKPIMFSHGKRYFSSDTSDGEYNAGMQTPALNHRSKSLVSKFAEMSGKGEGEEENQTDGEELVIDL